MLEIKTFEVGSFGTNMYLVSDDAGNILLIDPACSSLYEQQMLLRYVNSLPFTGEELCSIGLPVAVRRTLLGLGFFYSFFDASYVSIVLVWIITDVSAFCQYSDLVVMVRVTLHELSPNPAASAVRAAISTEMTTLIISFRVIILNFKF